MLLRSQGDGAIAITQPAHSWLAGQLARAWGNDAFAAPAPFEAFCLATEQHDLGWGEHDQVPVFDPKTGFPQTFWDVPATDHTALSADGVRRALVFGRYPALLISLHARTIYDLTFDFASASPGNAAAARDFLAGQAAFRADIVASLAIDPFLRTDVDPERIEGNRLLLLALDQLSLHACWGLRDPVEIRDVPGRDGQRHTLNLRPTDHPDRIAIDPWPFAGDRVEAHVEGRLLTRRAPDSAALARLFADAPRVTLTIEFRPA